MQAWTDEIRDLITVLYDTQHQAPTNIGHTVPKPELRVVTGAFFPVLKSTGLLTRRFQKRCAKEAEQLPQSIICEDETPGYADHLLAADYLYMATSDDRDRKRHV